MKRAISSISQHHSRGKGEAGYWRASTVRTNGAIGRRMGPAESHQTSEMWTLRRTGYTLRIEQCVCVWRGL